MILTPGTAVRATYGAHTYTGLVAETDEYDTAAGYVKVVTDQHNSGLLFLPSELEAIPAQVSVRKPVSLRKASSAVRQVADRRTLRQGRAVKLARKSVVLLNRPSYGLAEAGPLVAEFAGSHRTFVQVAPIG